MGNSVSLSKRFWPGNRFQEEYISLGSILSTIHTALQDERVAIGIMDQNPEDKLYQTTLPEFTPIFKPGGLTELMRNRYLAPDEECCINRLTYGWTDLLSTTQNANINKTLLTCYPSTGKMGFYPLCDDIMYNTCVNIFDSTKLKQCTVWFNSIYSRYQEAKNIIDDINTRMFNICKDNINNHNCILWLSAIRNNNGVEYYTIADSVLMNQSYESKKNLKCAFSPHDVEMNNRLNIKKECWYYECAISENWKLLTENINNRNMCIFNECNINIHDLNIFNADDMTIECNSTINVKSSKSEIDTILSESNFNRFLVPSNKSVFYIVVCYIFVVFLVMYKYG